VLVRAPQAPARLLSLDTTRAAGLPGVVSVLTPFDADVGGALRNEVGFPGQVIAAVVAETREAGERASAALAPVFGDVPPLVDDDAAPATRALLVTHAGREHESAALWARASQFNSLSYVLAARPLWLPLPPEVVVGHEAPGRMSVSTATAAPFALRRVVAATLGLPIHALRVRVPNLPPGGPSGLTPAHVQGVALCVLAARRSARAVRLTLARAEELADFALRAERRVEVRTLVEQGLPRALHLRLDVDLGACDVAFATARAQRAWRHAEQVARERLPGVLLHVSGSAWASTRPPALFDEAAASEAVTFALISWERDLERTYLRGEAAPLSYWLPRKTEASALETLALQRLQPRPTPERGEHLRHLRRGLAAAFGCWPGQAPSPVRSAAVDLLEDGALRARLGRPDIDGATLALLRARVAAQFELSLERVHVSLGDTDVAPLESDDDAPGEAHAADALLAATQALRARVLASAAACLELPVSALTLRDGVVEGAGRRVSLAELAAWSLAGQGLGPLATEAQAQQPSAAGRVAAAASVDVDLETGAVRVLGLALVVDVGAWPAREALARASGVAWRALSAALAERQAFDAHGQPLVASLAALHPARVGDVPTPLVTILTHPADDAGAGQAPVADWDETCAGTVAGALAHAIADACRTRPRHVPMGSEAVLRVLAPEDGLDTQPALP
jgi:CO/xanthine dehydrogenase Mo-binding subunit